MTGSYAMVNRRYVRISRHQALEMRFYLEPQDREWFNEDLLQMIVSDMKTLILPKLEDEKLLTRQKMANKRETVSNEYYSSVMYLVPTLTRHSTRNFVTKPEDANLDPDADASKPSMKIDYKGLPVHGRSVRVLVSRPNESRRTGNDDKSRIGRQLEHWIESSQSIVPPETGE